MKQQQPQKWSDKLATAIKEAEEHRERAFRLSDLFFNATDMAIKLHRLVCATLEVAANAVPMVGNIISGVGQLAHAVVKTKQLSHQDRIKTHQKVSVGIKVVTGVAYVALGAVGIAFPPLGLSMVAAAAGLSVGVTLYKSARTMYKYRQARSRLKHTSQTQEQRHAQQALDHQYKKSKKRLFQIGLGVASVGLAVGMVFAGPVVAPALLAGLLALNAGYFGKQMGWGKKLRARLRTKKSVATVTDSNTPSNDEQPAERVQDSLQPTVTVEQEPVETESVASQVTEKPQEDCKPTPLSPDASAKVQEPSQPIDGFLNGLEHAVDLHAQAQAQHSYAQQHPRYKAEEKSLLEEDDDEGKGGATASVHDDEKNEAPQTEQTLCSNDKAEPTKTEQTQYSNEKADAAKIKKDQVSGAVTQAGSAKETKVLEEQDDEGDGGITEAP